MGEKGMMEWGGDGMGQGGGVEATNQHSPTGFYANGVKLQSPVSRSARWVPDHPYDRTPTGFHKRPRDANEE